jgi:hypothetical protein
VARRDHPDVTKWRENDRQHALAKVQKINSMRLSKAVRLPLSSVRRSESRFIGIDWIGKLARGQNWLLSREWLLDHNSQHASISDSKKIVHLCTQAAERKLLDL